MRFLEIYLSNYRCFKNLNIVFSEKKGKPITLFLGANGAGKSEFLYSFLWILYGVDFSKFKGKEKFIWSLNLNAKTRLENNDTHEEVCMGELMFESDNIKYRVVKKETFNLNKKKELNLSSTEQSLYFLNSDSSWQLIETKTEGVAKRLKEIIPRSLLSGIIFDGEEMQEIASPTLSSKGIGKGNKQNGLDTIEGVIEKVTDVRVLSLAKSIFESSIQSIDKSINKQYKGANQSTLSDLNQKIDSLMTEIKKQNLELDGAEKTIEIKQKEFESVRLQFQKAEEYKKTFQEREKAKARYADAKNYSLERFNELKDSIKSGYLLITDELTSEMKKMVEKKDIPIGLTVEAAQSIMNQDRCICGSIMDEKAKSNIELLLKLLPPENINSQLLEETRGIDEDRESTLNSIADSWNKEHSSRINLLKIKDEIDELTQKLEGASNVEVNELIADCTRKEGEIEDLNKTLVGLKESINLNNDTLKKLESRRDSMVRLCNECNVLMKRKKVYCKFYNAIDNFQKRQSVVALENINVNLKKAYKELSEDYEKGRRLIIGRFDINRNKYQLIPYFETVVENALRRVRNSQEYEQEYNQLLQVFNDSQQANDCLLEKYIIENSDPSSQGQSAVAALSFVKAVMDYSISITPGLLSKGVSYPLVIDSPLSDIGNENLRKISKELPKFAEQILFLSSDTSFSLIQNNLGNSILESYVFTKVTSEDGVNSLVTKQEE